MNHSDTWFARQLEHAQEAMREAGKQHTAQELAEAEEALAVHPYARQGRLQLIASAQPGQGA